MHNNNILALTTLKNQFNFMRPLTLVETLYDTLWATRFSLWKCCTMSLLLYLYMYTYIFLLAPCNGRPGAMKYFFLNTCKNDFVIYALLLQWHCNRTFRYLMYEMAITTVLNHIAIFGLFVICLLGSFDPYVQCFTMINKQIINMGNST